MFLTEEAGKVFENVLENPFRSHADLSLTEENVYLPPCVRIFTSCLRERVSLLKRITNVESLRGSFSADSLPWQVKEYHSLGDPGTPGSMAVALKES